jgi:uncharacterized protein Yka (UPF0111/DUF47 family)
LKQKVTNDAWPPALAGLTMCVQEAVEILSSLVENPSADCESFIARMRQLRIEGILVAFHIEDELKSTSISPPKRARVGTLASALADVLDLVDGIMTEIMLRPDHSITLITAEMCRVLLLQVSEIAFTLTHVQYCAQAIERCVEICRLQNVADRMLQSEMACVWENKKDLPDIMTHWKLIDHLQRATGKAERIAELYHSIMLESA